MSAIAARTLAAAHAWRVHARPPTPTAGNADAAPTRKGGYTGRPVGAWRSLVAHLLWEQGVAGSNPAAPIFSSFLAKAMHRLALKLCIGWH
jgi:hypothetical protein